MPFKIVIESIFDTINVTKTLTKINIISINALINPELLLVTKNIVIKEIKSGNLPLHGTKLLVIIAINLSLGESIILAPVTPTALQPNPITIVKACFPQDEHFSNDLSKLKAILGNNPKSSSKVNSGKNIAIGGNITATTHAKTLYTP